MSAHPWYSVHTGTDLPVRVVPKETHHLAIYSLGVVGSSIVRGVVAKGENQAVANGAKRGAITGMSFHAAARLRETVMTRTPPGEAFSLTGTTRRARTDEEWRGIMQRFRMIVIRQNLAGVWRVELQKRKAPHVHCILWINEAFAHQDEVDQASMRLRWAWLRAIGAIKVRRNGETTIVDTQELEHAAVVDYGLTPGWLAYLAGHASKHKAEQLGWQGKQWGTWHAEKFAPVHELMRRDVSGPQKRLFDRSLRRWQSAKLRARTRREERAEGERVQIRERNEAVRKSLRDAQRGSRSDCAAGLAISSGVVGESGKGAACGDRSRRVRRRMPRALPRAGTYVRCYEGSNLTRLLRFIVGEGADPGASWDWFCAESSARSPSLP